MQGSYSVLLQSGLGPQDSPTSASIAQTGTIPESTLSIQFIARQVLGGLSPLLAVSIQGQNVPIVAISSNANYTVFGADISSYSGLASEVRIGSYPNGQYGSFLIDSIQFSNQPIPEPSAIGLVGLGALLFSYRTRLIRRT